MRFLLAGAVLMALSHAVSAQAADYKAGDVTVVDPWARATAGKPRNGGTFVTLKGGRLGDRLIGASTEVARKAELHNHINDNGVMRMRHVEQVEVPAGGMAMLQPGGLHIMMMGLKKPLIEGESFPLTLHFKKAGEVTVDVMIMGVGAKGAMTHGHTGHSKTGHGKMKQ
jgi:copper(I)-binding protein